MNISSEDCDRARLLNGGKIYLTIGDNFLDPKADITNIQFIGQQKFNGKILTSIIKKYNMKPK